MYIYMAKCSVNQFFEFFATDLRIALTFSPLAWNEVKSKCANRKPILNFLFDDNYNVCPICYRLRHIYCRIMHDL